MTPERNTSESLPPPLTKVGPPLLHRVVEAVIFAADDPVTAAQLGRVFSDVSGQDAPSNEEIAEVVERINAAYDATGRAFRVRAWAGGYRLATIRELAPYIKALREQDRARKLTQSLMETVAILAYRQPATRSDIEFVRGVNCDYAIRRLLEYGLVDVIGRADSIGRPLLYGTTDRFLDLFGLNAIGDLPNLREVEEIMDDPGFHKEKAKLMMSSGIEKAKESSGDKDE